jgi:hypothetical protein
MAAHRLVDCEYLCGMAVSIVVGDLVVGVWLCLSIGTLVLSTGRHLLLVVARRPWKLLF